MAYDATKDQVLKTWENDETGLIISTYRYGEGEPKRAGFQLTMCSG